MTAYDTSLNQFVSILGVFRAKDRQSWKDINDVHE